MGVLWWANRDRSQVFSVSDLNVKVLAKRFSHPYSFFLYWRVLLRLPHQFSNVIFTLCGCAGTSNQRPTTNTSAYWLSKHNSLNVIEQRVYVYIFSRLLTVMFQFSPFGHVVFVGLFLFFICFLFIQNVIDCCGPVTCVKAICEINYPRAHKVVGIV